MKRKTKIWKNNELLQVRENYNDSIVHHILEYNTCVKMIENNETEELILELKKSTTFN